MGGKMQDLKTGLGFTFDGLRMAGRGLAMAGDGLKFAALTLGFAIGAPFTPFFLTAREKKQVVCPGCGSGRNAPLPNASFQAERRICLDCNDTFET